MMLMERNSHPSFIINHSRQDICPFATSTLVPRPEFDQNPTLNQKLAIFLKYAVDYTQQQKLSLGFTALQTRRPFAAAQQTRSARQLPTNRIAASNTQAVCQMT